MTRYKTHLIAVKNFNDKEDMIMRDIRDAMEYLSIMMSHHHASTHQSQQQSGSNRAPQAHPSPATHIYCYDAEVLPFPHSSNHN